MRHNHPRGKRLTGYSGTLWCRACVTSGVTTIEESQRPEPKSRGAIRPGMEVSWIEYRASSGWHRLQGQVWAVYRDEQKACVVDINQVAFQVSLQILAEV